MHENDEQGQEREQGPREKSNAAYEVLTGTSADPLRGRSELRTVGTAACKTPNPQTGNSGHFSRARTRRYAVAVAGTMEATGRTWVKLLDGATRARALRSWDGLEPDLYSPESHEKQV